MSEQERPGKARKFPATNLGQYQGLEALNDMPLDDGTFTVHLDEGRFECLLLKKAEPRLFVLLSSARDPEVQELPKFERWSWAGRYPGSVLCVSDPTLYLDPASMRIGWYVGTSSKDWTGSLANLVGAIASRLNVSFKNIICYGSSAGGFASLMLACRLGPSTAVAINPQIDIRRYSKRHFGHFLSIAFQAQGTDSAKDVEHRFSAIEAYKQAEQAKCLIVQNTLDRAHYERHFSEFCRAFAVDPAADRTSNGRIETMLFQSPLGHGKEPHELVPQIISCAVALSESGFEKLELNEVRLSEQPLTDAPISSEQLYLQGARDENAPGLERIVFAPFGRKDVAPIEMVLPFDWGSNPYKDSNWCAQLQKWNMVNVYLLAYERLGDANLLRAAKDIMLDWYRYHVELGREAHMAWRDFVAGVRSMKIAFLMSQWQHGKVALSAQEKAKFLHLIVLHFDFILDGKNIKYTNHTFSDFHGAMALAQVVNAATRTAVEDFVLGLTPRLLESQFDAHGVHREHSFAYQGFGIGCLRRLAASKWFDRVHVDELVKRAESIRTWLYLPDGRLAPVGDTNGQESVPEQGKVVFKGEREVFNSSGYCIVRSDGNGKLPASSYFCLMGAFQTRIHKHPDDLSVLWFEGEDILCDAGKFAYKSHKHRLYVQTRRAHNSVEIDSDNYPIESQDAYGSAIRSVAETKWGFFGDTSFLHRRFDARHSRYFLYEPGKWLLLIDHLSAPRKHRFTQWFHFSPHLSLRQKATGKAFFAKLARSGRTLTVRCATSSPSEVQVVRGQHDPVIQGWVSQGYAKVSPSATLGISQEGENVTFASIFCLDDRGSRLTCKPNGNVLLDLKREGFSERLRFIPGDNGCRIIERTQVQARNP